MKLYIQLPSGNTAVLGTMFKVTYTDLKHYVKQYEEVWVRV